MLAPTGFKTSVTENEDDLGGITEPTARAGGGPATRRLTWSSSP